MQQKKTQQSNQSNRHDYRSSVHGISNTKCNKQKHNKVTKTINMTDPMDSLRGSSVKIGTIQRRLAWPLRKDDTHKSRSVNNKHNRSWTIGAGPLEELDLFDCRAVAIGAAYYCHCYHHCGSQQQQQQQQQLQQLQQLQQQQQQYRCQYK